MNPVRIIITGGTFDKHYDELQGVLSFKDSHIPDIIKQVRIRVPTVLELNQLIDSLDMLEENRQNILDACLRSPEDHIIITHGTDRMAETARILGEAVLPKTIVMTGAMIPYSVSGSDALFNLGTAFSAVQLLETGVYVCMNGRVFDWDKVRKNTETGSFEEASI